MVEGGVDKSIVRWILTQQNPGMYGVALWRLRHSTSSPINLGYVVRQFERTLIQETLNAVGGSQTRAAQLLMLNRTTLAARMKSLGIETMGRSRSWKKSIIALPGR